MGRGFVRIPCSCWLGYTALGRYTWEWITGMDIGLQAPDQKHLSVVLANGPSYGDLLELVLTSRRDLETTG